MYIYVSFHQIPYWDETTHLPRRNDPILFRFCIGRNNMRIGANRSDAKRLSANGKISEMT